VYDVRQDFVVGKEENEWDEGLEDDDDYFEDDFV
jgi:hypothetical protein